MEMNVERARRARENFARAGVSARANVVVGDARRNVAKVSGPFDLIFQDGDKQLYSPMLDRLTELLRPGGLLVTDNVLWDGRVVPGFAEAPKRENPDTAAIAEYNERLSRHPSLMTVILPLRDGVSVSAKKVSR
jgi:predicted O-methyltransferase YrrM